MSLRKLAQLEKEINTKRQEMVKLGMELGFTHPRTVQVSQELDILINQHLKEQVKGQ
jgi:stage 0 sporulation regulatory protein